MEDEGRVLGSRIETSVSFEYRYTCTGIGSSCIYRMGGRFIGIFFRIEKKCKECLGK